MADRFIITALDTKTDQEVILFTWRGTKQDGLAQARIGAAKHSRTYINFHAHKLAD